MMAFIIGYTSNTLTSAFMNPEVADLLSLITNDHVIVLLHKTECAFALKDIVEQQEKSLNTVLNHSSKKFCQQISQKISTDINALLFNTQKNIEAIIDHYHTLSMNTWKQKNPILEDYPALYENLIPLYHALLKKYTAINPNTTAQQITPKRQNLVEQAKKNKFASFVVDVLFDKPDAAMGNIKTLAEENKDSITTPSLSASMTTESQVKKAILEQNYEATQEFILSLDNKFFDCLYARNEYIIEIIDFIATHKNLPEKSESIKNLLASIVRKETTHLMKIATIETITALNRAPQYIPENANFNCQYQRERYNVIANKYSSALDCNQNNNSPKLRYYLDQFNSIAYNLCKKFSEPFGKDACTRKQKASPKAVIK